MQTSVLAFSATGGMWALGGAWLLALLAEPRGLDPLEAWDSALGWSAEVAPWVLPMYLTAFIAAGAIVIIPEGRSAFSSDPALRREWDNIRLFVGTSGGLVASALGAWWLCCLLGTIFVPGPTRAGNIGVLLAVPPLVIVALLLDRTSQATREQRFEIQLSTLVRHRVWRIRVRSIARVELGDRGLGWARRVFVSALLIAPATAVLVGLASSMFWYRSYIGIVLWEAVALGGSVWMWAQRYKIPSRFGRIAVAAVAMMLLSLVLIERFWLASVTPQSLGKVVLVAGIIIPLVAIFLPALGRRVLAAAALESLTKVVNGSRQRLRLHRRQLERSEAANTRPATRRWWHARSARVGRT